VLYICVESLVKQKCDNCRQFSWCLIGKRYVEDMLLLRSEQSVVLAGTFCLFHYKQVGSGSFTDQRSVVVVKYSAGNQLMY
jgi:hypothetical protein